MKANIENLKANRLEIIERLKAQFGLENLKSAMSILKNEVEFAELYYPYQTMDMVFEKLVETSPFQSSRRKTSATAELLEKIEENAGQTWDSKKRKYVQI